MNRKLFELSEEEKNSIRELHESYKKVHGTFSLTEQGARKTGIKMTEPGKLDFDINRTKETGSLTSTYDETAEDFFTEKDNQEVKGYYNDPSSNWKSLIDGYIKKKIKIWDFKSKKIFNNVMETSPYLIFNIAAQINDSDANSVYKTAKRVVLEEPTIETTIKPGSPGTEPDIDYIVFNPPPIKEGTSDFFADNSWVPTDSMKNYVKKYILSAVLEVIENGKKKTGEAPVLFLNNLGVSSSVSRFLNSIDNDGNSIPIGDNPNRMSFETLSTKRADAAVAYLKQVLSPYVSWDETVITGNTKGGNGDGSSGPDPYKEAEELIKSGKFRDYASVFSSPGFRKKYDPYKYTNFNMSIGIVPIKKPVPIPGEEPKPDEILEKETLKVLFFYKDTDFDFTLKLPKFDWSYTSSAKAPGFWKVDKSKCKLKWWEKIITKYFVPDKF